jgi:methionine synthase II (cobalamin-independent)
LLQLAGEVIRIVLSITTRKLETELSVSQGNVNNIIDSLGCSTVRVPWVPLSLNDKNSENSENLETSGREKIVNFRKENISTDLKVILKKQLKKFVEKNEGVMSPNFYLQASNLMFLVKNN